MHWGDGMRMSKRSPFKLVTCGSPTTDAVSLTVVVPPDCPAAAGTVVVVVTAVVVVVVVVTAVVVVQTAANGALPCILILECTGKSHSVAPVNEIVPWTVFSAAMVTTSAWLPL